MKTIGKAFILLIAVLLIILSVICLYIHVNSPGRLPDLTDTNGNVIEGSLTEKKKIEIGGIEQGFFIRSENTSNPVILFLHGGPGSPELPMVIACEKEGEDRLEKYFTVCYWDQRGAGMSYSGSLDPANATVEQFVEDTRQMTSYLMKRFDKEKIYLMGHSWGSYLGVKTVEKYPELYHAYIGIGQVTNQLLSEKLAYEYMLTKAQDENDQQAIKELSKFDYKAADFPSPGYLAGPRMKYMNKYGIGITHEPYEMSQLGKDIMLYKGYTFGEKIKYIRGSIFSLQHVFYNVIEDNLFNTSTIFDLPVYIIHGKYDYQVSHLLAKEWLNTIVAPEKQFFTFEHAAHSPNLEETSRFIQILRRIESAEKKIPNKPPIL